MKKLPFLFAVLIFNQSALATFTFIDNRGGAIYIVDSGAARTGGARTTGYNTLTSLTIDTPEVTNEGGLMDGDGFLLNINALGGGVIDNLGIQGGGGNANSSGARFAFTVGANVSSITLDVLYDQLLSPSNPARDNPGGGSEAIFALLGVPMTPTVQADLMFNPLVTGSINNPNLQTATFNSATNNFNIQERTGLTGSGNTFQPSGIFSFDNTTFNGQTTGFTATVTPTSGTTFVAGTQFILTLDGTFTALVPEPSSSLLLLAAASIGFIRRRRS